MSFIYIFTEKFKRIFFNKDFSNQIIIFWLYILNCFSSMWHETHSFSPSWKNKSYMWAVLLLIFVRILEKAWWADLSFQIIYSIPTTQHRPVGFGRCCGNLYFSWQGKKESEESHILLDGFTLQKELIQSFPETVNMVFTKYMLPHIYGHILFCGP